MALRFNYITVPHTGTRFFNGVFFRLGFRNITRSTPRIIRKPENVKRDPHAKVQYHMYHCPLGYELQGTTDDYTVVLPINAINAPVVTTLRDPYLVAISHLHKEGAHIDIDKLCSMYDYIIFLSAKKTLTYANIHCEPHKRENHIIAILKQLNVYEDSLMSRLEYAIKDWTPVGATSNEWKQNYIENGKLPSGFAWYKLDRAVRWYNNKLSECRYDNIT